MRWFWGLMMVAVVVAGVLVMRPASGGGGAKKIEERAGAPAPEVVGAPALPIVVPSAAEGEGAAMEPKEVEPKQVEPKQVELKKVDVKKVDVVDKKMSVTEVKGGEAVAGTGGGSALAGKQPVPPVPVDVGGKSLENALDAALGLTSEVELVGPIEGDSKSAAEPKPAATGGAAASSAKAKLAEQADGSVLVDDKFVVKGKGTESEPFIVSWEMLISAQDTYQPRLGRKEIPDRLKMLSGKWVKISGFIAFPIMAQSQDEMLMMLNQWDGCCIGVPPTPYDAIEVKLKKGVVGEERLRVSGAVKGILRVDPYLIKDWLVSLYLMDDAQLMVEGKAEIRKAGAHKGGLGGGLGGVEGVPGEEEQQ